MSRKIPINQVFLNRLKQNPHKDVYDSYEDWQWDIVTRGKYDKRADPQVGIFTWRKVNGIRPAIFFHSNPYEEEKKNKPWRDLIFQDKGFVLYNGDNKDPRFKAHESKGNKQVLDVLPLYFSKNIEDRYKAPPIIVTRTVNINGSKAFREFVGFGVISSNQRLIHQYNENMNVFSNFQYEVALLHLYPDNEFDWAWIDDRRDKDIAIKDKIERAPQSWKTWVEKGSDHIDDIRFKINSTYTESVDSQKKLSIKEDDIIKKLLNEFYPYEGKNRNANAIRFESMSAFIAQLYFEESGYFYRTGWITKGTGDRGVDFVGRLEIGNDHFSKNTLIVLGQSKRYSGLINGESLTRIASRMTRGYMGVVVTLDAFSVAGQREVKDDRLPIIMINGKKVAQLLLDYISKTKNNLQNIVDERDAWMRNNTKGHHNYEAVYHMDLG